MDGGHVGNVNGSKSTAMEGINLTGASNTTLSNTMTEGSHLPADPHANQPAYTTTRSRRLKLGSLNCRTLYKHYDIHKSDLFIKYLRLHQFYILLCQETNIRPSTFADTTQLLNMNFQTHQSLWSSHCAILNFSSSFHIDPIKIADDGRFILAKLTIPSENSFSPIYLLNIYAPATNNTGQRNTFFSSLIQYLLSLMSSIPDLLESMLVAGDFNFNFDSACVHHTRQSRFPRDMVQFVGAHFRDCLNDSNRFDEHYTPTFRGGANYSMACLDYIFAGFLLHFIVNNGDISFLSRD
ncbi:MAG: hypothetical protein EXX96DRAFT_114152 [Benjaminiella poitrasii]|nr:MAG: hypothetical protein EXX96DRAFT_114152 [Benjaminiella poitrasii]